MTLKDIAYRNLVRRKGKTAFVLAGLVIGVATVVTVMTLSTAMTNDINHKLDKYGANILIVPKTESLTLNYGGLSLGGISFDMQELYESELAQISSIKNAANIAAVGPMLLGVISIASQKVLLAGVDMTASQILKPWWNVKGKFPDEGSVLAGAELAQITQLEVGKTIEVNGQTLTVSGILEPTGSQDDQLVFTRLTTAQTLLGKTGKVSMVEVAALCTACPVEDIVQQISEVMPNAKVMAIQQVVKSRMEAIMHFKKLSYGVSGIVILIGGLVVLVTMMSSVRERSREIGIFRAIGFRRRHVMHIVLLEAIMMSTFAGISGYIAGLGATKLTLRFFTESQGVHLPLSPELAIGSVLLAILIGMASSAYPALLAAQLDPNEALRAL